MRARVASALGVLAAVAAPGLAAQLTVSVPAGPFAVGDRVPVTVTVPGDGASWAPDELPAGTDASWVVASEPRRLDAGSWEIRLVPLEVGELELPALTMRSADGERAVAAERPTVTVESVLPPGEEQPQPAPLRAPVGAPGWPWEWLPPVGLALLPLLAGLVWWRSRRRDGDGRAAVTALPPWVELKRALDDIERRLSNRPAALSCDQLAAAVRLYLERLCDEPAMEMTSTELGRMAKRLEWAAELQHALRAVLETTDRVRFARAKIPAGQMASAVSAARDLGAGLERLLEHERTAAEEAA